MVRACKPPARDPARSWLARRSTMTTSTPANASSPANIIPVGPPPAITTECSVVNKFMSLLLLRVSSGFGQKVRPMPATLRHEPGLEASPQVRYILNMGGRYIFLSLIRKIPSRHDWVIPLKLSTRRVGQIVPHRTALTEEEFFAADRLHPVQAALCRQADVPGCISPNSTCRGRRLTPAS